MNWLWKHGYLFRAHLTLSTVLMLLGLLLGTQVIGLNAFFVGVSVTLVVLMGELIMEYRRRGRN